MSKNWVYFIRSTDTSHVKIGTTILSPHARLRALQTGNPSELVLLGAMPGDASLEKRLHTRFDAIRVRGEWFRETPELLGFIEGATMFAEQPAPDTPELDDKADGFRLFGFIDAWTASRMARKFLDANGYPATPRRLMADELCAAAEAIDALEHVIRCGGGDGYHGEGVRSFPFTQEHMQSDMDSIQDALDSHHDAIAEEQLASDAHRSADPSILSAELALDDARADFDDINGAAEVWN